MVEHAYVSNRADEERKKRPYYKPIIEHDGLPKKPPSNQVFSFLIYLMYYELRMFYFTV